MIAKKMWAAAHRIINEAERDYRESGKKLKNPGKLSLYEAGLGDSVANILDDAGIYTVDDVRSMTVEELRGITNVGILSVELCQEMLDRMGLAFQEDI